MSSTPRNRQLGPYTLGAKYKNTGELGRFYRARHSETGAPALIIEPTKRHPEDAPLADWQVHLSSSVSPPYLALEVQGSPGTAEAWAAGEELEYMLDDWNAALAHALERPETLRHLRAPPRPPLRPRTDWRPRLFGAGLAAAFALLIVRSTPTAPLGLEREIARAQLAPVAFDAGTGDVTGVVLTDTVDTQFFGLARPMPDKPFKVQKRPPCEAPLEVEENGGCWVPHEVHAPCPDKLYELKGRCFLPAAKSEPKPTSIVR